MYFPFFKLQAEQKIRRPSADDLFRGSLAHFATHPQFKFQGERYENYGVLVIFGPCFLRK